VRLTVEVVEPSNAMLELAGEVYAGLSEEQINEIEQFYTKREDSFLPPFVVVSPYNNE
jgi:hypothetical protein